MFVNAEHTISAEKEVTMKTRRVTMSVPVCAILLSALQPSALKAGVLYRNAQQQAPERTEIYLTREVRRQLVMLPYYSIFDWLAYRVSGYDIELTGYAVRPSLKSEAGNVVKGIEGVQKVTNNIKVLPPSPMDHRIRFAEYRSIYGYPGFEKYAIQAVGPIHIVVDSGHVILEGIVDSQADQHIADVRAKSVHGVFSVTDNLRVVSGAR
jgi:hyperosmotically inducible periplasmic protein